MSTSRRNILIGAAASMAALAVAPLLHLDDVVVLHRIPSYVSVSRFQDFMAALREKVESVMRDLLFRFNDETTRVYAKYEIRIWVERYMAEHPNVVRNFKVVADETNNNLKHTLFMDIYLQSCWSTKFTRISARTGTTTRHLG